MSGDDLAKALARLEYEQTRQTGSHMRLTTGRNGEHHVTIPRHDPLKVGTLSGILREVGDHARMSRDELAKLLFS